MTLSGSSNLFKVQHNHAGIFCPFRSREGGSLPALLIAFTAQANQSCFKSIMERDQSKLAREI